jgi:hypothetical protein
MKHKTKIILLFSLCALLLAGTALAAGDYQISWWTVDSGGGSSQSADGQYTLNGTVGQPDVGSAAGIGYALHGGFWQEITTAIQEFLIHLPWVSR